MPRPPAPAPTPTTPPAPAPPTTGPAAFEAAVEALAGHRVVVLTGAGVSTDSGIPDYRSPRAHARRAPMQHDAFVRDAAARRRYWARSAAGWPRVAAAAPNAAHDALARLEAAGVAVGVITQNVDGLHQRAGSRRVVELHGTLAQTRCLGCGARTPRAWVQREMARLNPGHPLDARLAPDGDADLPDAVAEAFAVPPCPRCGGALMPDVVFFGGSVPRATVDAAWALFDEADALLVAGSSLAVYSGYRFALRAEKDGRPSALVTLGPTRADARVRAKLEAPLGTALPRLAARLIAASATA